MFGALAHGLPQVTLPQGADNYINAELIARSGSGVSLGPDAVVPEAVREALRSVLAEPSYASAARRIASQMADLPGPEEVAAALRRRFDNSWVRR